jgi:hypothetical protein
MQVLIWCLSAAILASAGLIGAVHVRTGESGALVAGTTILPPAGVTLQGTSLDLAKSPAVCHLIRFASRSCEFSRSDRLFNQVELTALRAGCDSIILAPSDTSYDCDASASHNRHHHLSYPTMATVRALRLEATPTTMIVDNAWRVVWVQIGVLSEQDVSYALRHLPAAPL